MRLWSFASSCLLIASVSIDASAYCRTSTGGISAGCHPSGSDCCTVGKPIFWRTACVGFSMQQDGTGKRDISYVRASRTIAQGFNVWTSASCPGGQSSSRVSIDVRQLPPVECGDVQTKLDAPNQNMIVFRDASWPHNDPDNTLALTTVSFDTSTGEIRGADLEFNTANIPIACPSLSSTDVTDSSCFDGPPLSGTSFDFASIATHELGHFLGMAHSNDTSATMTPQYSSGQYTLRTLTADDIAGICNIYPPDGTRNTGMGGQEKTPEGPCDPTPLNGFTTTCSEKKCFIFCCSSAGTGVGALGPRSSEAALGACALGAVLMVRRKRRTRRGAS